MQEPAAILSAAYERAASALNAPAIAEGAVRKRIEDVARDLAARKGIRLVLACLLAKLDQPHVDIRQPYSGIDPDRSYSGRDYDETFLTPFVDRLRLPSTAPVFRTFPFGDLNRPLTPDAVIIKWQPRRYRSALHLLDDIEADRVAASDALAEMIRQLLLLREEHSRRIALFKKAVVGVADEVLSSEAIVNLIRQHLACRNASRLPVLVVTAAYRAVAERIGECPRRLLAHNAADEQTGAIGDVEIHLTGEDHTVTSYEMKLKAVTRDDIDRAVTKIVGHDPPIQNYLFVTTEPTDQAVHDYAASLYDRLGVEIAVLDCLGFLRHFLHFFHRDRMAFLEAYQELLLAEPESAVRQALKEAFLTLRLAAETGDEPS
jgi:hypothetical protein